jgi:hypothetical protein
MFFTLFTRFEELMFSLDGWMLILELKKLNPVPKYEF